MLAAAAYRFVAGPQRLRRVFRETSRLLCGKRRQDQQSIL
jgi:hypothetical protein